MLGTQLAHLLIFFAAVTQLIPSGQSQQVTPTRGEPSGSVVPNNLLKDINMNPVAEGEGDTQTTINVKELRTYKLPEEEDSVENAGFRMSRPGQKAHGIRHVKAHDGFHNIKREPLWAHWNDVFTSSTKQPGLESVNQTAP